MYKAFDSVPHSWILKAFDLFEISSVLINFLRINMPMWETILNLALQNDNFKSKPIKINFGNFQGDSVSLLIFCSFLMHLSKQLNQTGGYNIQKRSINHLFYMDDLKLLTKEDNDLEGLLETVKKFSGKEES